MISIYGKEHECVSESHVPDEGDDIQSRRVIGIAKELHQRMDNASSNFRELHSTDMNGLNQ
jgi:hypothetical protein